MEMFDAAQRGFREGHCVVCLGSLMRNKLSLTTVEDSCPSYLWWLSRISSSNVFINVLPAPTPLHNKDSHILVWLSKCTANMVLRYYPAARQSASITPLS